VSTCSGWHRQRSSSADILDKLWTSVIVEPLSKDELLQVIYLNVLCIGDVSSIHFSEHSPLIGIKTCMVHVRIIDLCIIWL